MKNLECLEDFWAFLMLLKYLERRWLTVITDQEALRLILNITDYTLNLARWKLIFQELEFDVFYRAVIKH